MRSQRPLRRRGNEGAGYVGDRRGFRLALTDLRLPGIDGVEFLRRIRGRFPSLPVIVMTAFGTVETAVDANEIRCQRLSFETLSLDDLMITIDKVLELHACVTKT